MSTATFDDLGLAPNSYDNGSGGGGGFTSGGVHFSNAYNADWDSWHGFASSTVTDNVTPGFDNQYSAIPGEGAAGSAAYSVAFWDSFSGVNPTLVLPFETDLVSIELTNSTYAYFSMLNGDSFAKQFGGATGDDPDWFMLTIEAFDASDLSRGSLDFYLADYRFEDNGLDYLLEEWTYLDLSGFTAVKSLEFTLSSSDNGRFGMNTPAYFALDNVSFVPEPTAGALTALSLAAFGLRRRFGPHA